MADADEPAGDDARVGRLAQLLRQAGLRSGLIQSASHSRAHAPDGGDAEAHRRIARCAIPVLRRPGDRCRQLGLCDPQVQRHDDRLAGARQREGSLDHPLVRDDQARVRRRDQLVVVRGTDRDRALVVYGLERAAHRGLSAGRVHTADRDARDVRAVGQLLRRVGTREHGSGHDEEHGEGRNAAHRELMLEAARHLECRAQCGL